MLFVVRYSWCRLLFGIVGAVSSLFGVCRVLLFVVCVACRLLIVVVCRLVLFLFGVVWCFSLLDCCLLSFDVCLRLAFAVFA